MALTFILSPNMGLPIPIPDVDPGPDYALNIDSCFSFLDGHNHSPGSGVQVTPAGLNINSDLSFLGNNATTLRSVRFNPNSSPIPAVSPDLGILYEAGTDLWINDGVGNQIRLTQNGAIAGAPGAISGLVPPASISYISADTTFVFQSDVNTPASIDVGSVIIRDIAANSEGITLSPPNALAASYNVTYPAGAPTVPSVMVTNSSGLSTWESTFNAIVGSSAQVAAGSANYTSLTAALAAASANWSIKILAGAYTENPTISLAGMKITGPQNAIITGNLSFTGATYAQLTGFQLIGNITLDASSTGNTLDNVFVSNSLVWTDNGTGNYCRLIQG